MTKVKLFAGAGLFALASVTGAIAVAQDADV